MDQKPVEEASIYCGRGGGGEMKRSQSELALEELFSKDEKVGGKIWTQRARVFADADAFLGLDVSQAHSKCFCDVCATTADLTISFRYQETMNSVPSCGGLTDNILWPENVTSNQSCISATIESQSSICVSSPDDDDIETEAGQCEQSTDPLNLKRAKRMVSNRESARRSRRRKPSNPTMLSSKSRRKVVPAAADGGDSADKLDQLLLSASICNGEDLGPLIRKAFASGKPETLLPHLRHFSKSQEAEIEDVCRAHYQDFIIAVDDLRSLLSDVDSLKISLWLSNYAFQSTSLMLVFLEFFMRFIGLH